MPYAYDRNVIVQFLTGSGDATITRGTNDLAAKVNTNRIVTVDVRPNTLLPPGALKNALTAELGGLTAQSRLYLRGHGDWKHRTLGGWTARHVTGLLVSCGLAQPRLISVTGCNCARTVDFGAEASSGGGGESYHQVKAARQGLLDGSVHSFAGLLHYRLGNNHGIRCDLYGRTYFVTVLGPLGATENLRDMYAELGEGRKITATDRADSEKHDRAFSKIRFYWNGAQQMREWVQYA
jgi:hypothetical protein